MITETIQGGALPPFGQASLIGEGIYWTRIPMPGPLAWVNSFLFEDPDGWSVIDCGPDTAAGRDIWDSLLSGPLAGRPVKWVIITHGHNDHSGLAGYLVSRTKAKLLCSRREYESAQHRSARSDSPEDIAAFLQSLDAAPDDISLMVTQRQQSDARICRLPDIYTELSHGENLTLAGQTWTVLSTPGHSPAHVSLFHSTLGIFLSGDTLLERITPFIGVEYDVPRANPLGDYLSTLRSLADLPAGMTVLPGHGRPFLGAAERAKALLTHHQERLAEFRSLIAGGSVREYAMAVFPRAMNGQHTRLALAETLAHLNYLAEEGLISETSAQPLRFSKTG